MLSPPQKEEFMKVKVSGFVRCCCCCLCDMSHVMEMIRMKHGKKPLWRLKIVCNLGFGLACGESNLANTCNAMLNVEKVTTTVGHS
jgi:hypothetical protein